MTVTEGNEKAYVTVTEGNEKAYVTVTEGNEGARRSIIENGQKLVIENLCRDCTGEGEHRSDIMNIQCLARNKHNYVFAEAYLNVLGKSVFRLH